LETAHWVTVDDTAARHAGRDEYTTHIGNDRFAWFATRPSKSRALDGQPPRAESAFPQLRLLALDD
jgi:hypothetical protein